MKLHRFNDRGLLQFNQYLDALAVDPSLKPPAELLTAADCVETITPGMDIAEQEFANRLEAGSYLHGVLSKITSTDVLRDTGLWSWLSLFYFDQVCPENENRQRKPGERARYVPAISSYRKYYRHLLAGPYRVYVAHRDDPARALVLLCGPLHKPGEIVEQLVSQQEIITNPNAVDLATSIYYDPGSGSFRRGAAGKGKGSARRLADILNQFDLTWDLYWMPTDVILAKLPREFERFRKAAIVRSPSPALSR